MNSTFCNIFQYLWQISIFDYLVIWFENRQAPGAVEVWGLSQSTNETVSDERNLCFRSKSPTLSYRLCEIENILSTNKQSHKQGWCGNGIAKQQTWAWFSAVESPLRGRLTFRFCSGTAAAPQQHQCLSVFDPRQLNNRILRFAIIVRNVS